MKITGNPTTQNLYENFSPWALLLISLGVTMIGFQFIGAFLGVALAFPFYSGDTTSFIAALMDPTSDEGMRMPFLIMQGVGSFTGFILLPWLLIKFLYKGRILDFAPRRANELMIGVVLFITLFFMGVNAPFIEWNQNLVLPESLAGIEKVLRELEDTLAKTSEFITEFSSLGQLLIGIIVIAIIPGIGEELVFRGLVQNHMFRISKNIHVAIWVSALLFSLFHMQFYGLIPRMLLGALFGYLYYFSGNIIYPMVAHFFNNGFTLLMLYFYNQGMVEYNIDETDVLPWPQVAISAVLTFGLIYIFQKKAKNAAVE